MNKYITILATLFILVNHCSFANDFIYKKVINEFLFFKIVIQSDSPRKISCPYIIVNKNDQIEISIRDSKGSIIHVSGIVDFYTQPALAPPIIFSTVRIIEGKITFRLADITKTQELLPKATINLDYSKVKFQDNFYNEFLAREKRWFVNFILNEDRRNNVSNRCCPITRIKN